MTRRTSVRGRLAFFAVAAGLLLAAEVRVRSAAGPDFTRFVAVGDSLTAGYQNDSLLASQQVNGLASLIAQQAGVPLALPLIAPPGIPNVIVDVNPGLPPTFTRAPGSSPGRLNPLVQAMNLAVPGHTVHDALITRPNLPIDSLTDLVLGVPALFNGIARSQIEWAEAVSPTTILLWLGSADALRTIFIASPIGLTPPASFASDYAAVMQRLAATGATLIVANVPDVTRVPYLTRAEDAAAFVGLPLATIGPVLGIGSGDAITPNGLALISSILANPALGPLPDAVVLTSAEAITIRSAIDAYNAIITAQAELHGATLVDVHGLFGDLHERGYTVLGRELTPSFFGGIFSLDGIHPTNTGYAILANEVIRTMNRQLGSDIPSLPIARIANDDPLIGPRVPPGTVR